MSRQHTQSRRQFIATALVAPLAAGAALAAQTAAQTPAPKPMKIGIIGSGRQGGAIGLQWAKAGHEIFFSSRNPGNLKELVARAGAKARAGTPAEAAKFGDVILVAVPYGELPNVGRDHAALMKGKVVIDVGNPRVDRDGQVGADALKRGTGVASAEHLPGVRLVRALNALSFTQVDTQAHRAGEKLGIPIAGDDKAAVDIATQLVIDAGFEPVFVGGLARAREFDAGTPVYVRGMTARQLREALKLQ